MTTFSILDPDSGVAALETLITLEEAKHLHQSGVINTKTLVLIFFRTQLAETAETLASKEVYESLGISPASFYRALETLQANGLIHRN